MKKVLLLPLAIIVVAVAGIIGYQKCVTPTGFNDLMLANVEALASGESGGSITGECWQSVVIITECRVACSCGTVWYPSPRVPKASAQNVTGSCSRCGNSSWGY